MITLQVDTLIAATRERCFDLARSVDAHVASTRHTRERAIAGRITGLMEIGEDVTWQARHLCVRQRFTSRITGFDRPAWFRDEMLRGAFRSFTHDHYFTDALGGTNMVDVLRFSAPWGPLGSLAERALLARYLRRFLERRARVLKTLAQGDGWRAFVTA